MRARARACECACTRTIRTMYSSPAAEATSGDAGFLSWLTDTGMGVMDGWMGGWEDGGMGGWVDGGMREGASAGEASLRITAL